MAKDRPPSTGRNRGASHGTGEYASPTPEKRVEGLTVPHAEPSATILSRARRLARNTPESKLSGGPDFLDKSENEPAENKRAELIKYLHESVQVLEESKLSPHQKASQLHEAARSLHIFRDLAGAQSLYERALMIYEKLLGSEQANTAATLAGLANVLRDQGEFVKTRSLYERALAIYEQVEGSTGPRTVGMQTSLATLDSARAGASPKVDDGANETVAKGTNPSSLERWAGSRTERLPARELNKREYSKTDLIARLEEVEAAAREVCPEIIPGLRRSKIIAKGMPPKWGDPDLPENLKVLTAPLFLKYYYRDLIVDGVVDRSVIREFDRSLMADIEQYIFRRKKRKLDLGDATGLRFVGGRFDEQLEHGGSFRKKSTGGRPARKTRRSIRAATP